MVKAFLAGVSDYSGLSGYDNLPFSGNDIRLMASALMNGLAVNPMHIRTAGLASGKLTVDSISMELKAFCSGINEDDILIFYYTGHGTIINGKHCLLLSDGPMMTDSLLDLCRELKAKSRLLILDCCMSGSHQIHDPAIMDAQGWIDAFLENGYAVLASSRKDQRSCIAAGKEVSLFTAFLADALMSRFIIREGKKSMESIWSLVRLRADIWNERHPDQMQNPVFRSSIGGTVNFCVEEYHPYIRGSFYSEDEDCIIAEVLPLHSSATKRYAVKCILKHPVTESGLACIVRGITVKIRNVEIYNNRLSENRWKGKPINIVFGYFGNDETDLENDNYEYRTTWVDDTQDKQWWYGRNGSGSGAGKGDNVRNAQSGGSQEGDNGAGNAGSYESMSDAGNAGSGEVVDDVLIVRNRSYDLLRRLNEKYTGTPQEILTGTKEIISGMVSLAEQVISGYREMRSGGISEDQLAEKLAPFLSQITKLYFEESEQKIPPAGFHDWSLACSALAASIHDFTLVYGKKYLNDRTPQSRHQYMDLLMERYQENLAFLQVMSEKM